MQTASLVLAYSRMLFFQFYPQSRRFEGEGFLTDALRYMEHAQQGAARCAMRSSSMASGPSRRRYVERECDLRDLLVEGGGARPRPSREEREPIAIGVTIRKQGRKYRCFIHHDNRRTSRVFPTKEIAKVFATCA